MEMEDADLKSDLWDTILKNDPDFLRSEIDASIMLQDIPSIDEHTLLRIKDIFSPEGKSRVDLVSMLTKCLKDHPDPKIRRKSAGIFGRHVGVDALDYLLNGIK